MQKTLIFKFQKWLKLLWNRGRGEVSIFGDSTQLLWKFLPFFCWLPLVDSHTKCGYFTNVINDVFRIFRNVLYRSEKSCQALCSLLGAILWQQRASWLVVTSYCFILHWALSLSQLQTGRIVNKNSNKCFILMFYHNIYVFFILFWLSLSLSLHFALTKHW